MFDIEYKGGNGVVIATKKTTLVVDPKLSLVGLKDLSVKDAVELATEARFAVNDPTARLVIEGPGEYEVGDFSIRGVAAQRHLDTEETEKIATAYRIEVGEVRIAILGNIAPQLSDEQLEALGVVDILILPVGGGGYTLDATSAATVTRHIDPKVVIPVHYGDSALAYEVPQDDVEVFNKELGAPVETVTAKYKVKSIIALPEVLTTVVLSRG
jgi:L-ascorbate metabolism protein UlaG (beta-lactamase superfamily)